MPQTYVARKRLKVGSTIIEPGQPVPQAATWRNLQSYLSAGSVVLVRTGFKQRYPVKKKIADPASTADDNWRSKKPYRLHGWQYFGLGHPGPNPQ